MKVGIVTVHDSSNIGSYLQAFGMQEVVKQNGDTPYFIQTRSKFTTFCLYMGYNNAPYARSLKGFVHFCLKSLFNLRETRERYEKYKAYQRDWSRFENIISVKEANKMELDVLLLGSDEIWNARQPAFRNPLLYGVGIKAKKKIAYAVSAGNMEADGWKPYSKLIAGIRSLSGIIVRDDYTKSILQAYGIMVAGRICDPTLQVDIRSYMKSEKDVKVPAGAYMVVYSYLVDENTAGAIQRFAQKHGLKTVAVSLPQPWCDEYLNCSPLEFGVILSGASYVYTSTFHGTIFSVLYHVQFVVNPFSQKVTDVLELLGLTQFMIGSDCTMEQFEKLMQQQRNYSAVEEKIQDLKKESQIMYKRYVHQRN